MKITTRWKKLLLSCICGLILGTGASLLLCYGIIPTPLKPTDLCFYIGIAAVLFGLIAMMRGNPSMGGGGDSNGLDVKFTASVAVQEDQTTKSRGTGFFRNHVMELNLTGVFLLMLGIAAICGAVIPVLLFGM